VALSLREGKEGQSSGRGCRISETCQVNLQDKSWRKTCKVKNLQGGKGLESLGERGALAKSLMRGRNPTSRRPARRHAAPWRCGGGGGGGGGQVRGREAAGLGGRDGLALTARDVRARDRAAQLEASVLRRESGASGMGRDVRPICTGRGEMCVRSVRGGERCASDLYGAGRYVRPICTGQRDMCVRSVRGRERCASDLYVGAPCMRARRARWSWPRSQGRMGAPRPFSTPARGG
jgi:hypothetical protein